MGTLPLWTAPLAWVQPPWKLSAKCKAHTIPGFPSCHLPTAWSGDCVGWGMRALEGWPGSLLGPVISHFDTKKVGWTGRGGGWYNLPCWQQPQQIQYFTNHIPSWAVITVTQLTRDKILFLKSEMQKSNVIFVKQAHVWDLKPLYMVKPLCTKTTL